MPQGVESDHGAPLETKAAARAPNPSWPPCNTSPTWPIPEPHSQSANELPPWQEAAGAELRAAACQLAACTVTG